MSDDRLIWTSEIDTKTSKTKKHNKKQISLKFHVFVCDAFLNVPMKRYISVLMNTSVHKWSRLPKSKWRILNGPLREARFTRVVCLFVLNMDMRAKVERGNWGYPACIYVIRVYLCQIFLYVRIELYLRIGGASFVDKCCNTVISSAFLPRPNRPFLYIAHRQKRLSFPLSIDLAAYPLVSNA